MQLIDPEGLKRHVSVVLDLLISNGDVYINVLNAVYQAIDEMPKHEEQEPRVLTKKETYELPDETDVWCEQRDSKRMVAMTTLCEKYFMLRPTFSMGLESNDIRFWTARPTEEQRKAVPWDTH